jgi:hypothetical protein
MNAFCRPARLLLWLLLAAAAAVATGARADDVAAPLPQGIHLPVSNHLSVRLLNVSRLDETKGEISARIEFTENWLDPERAFDPLQAELYRKDYYGVEASGLLKTVWHPETVIANQISDPRSQSVAVSVTSAGEITMIRQIDADFRIAVNLAAFPFDSQQLTFTFMTPRYSASEVIFLIDDRDREASSLARELSLPDWHPESLNFALERFSGWNAKPFARAQVTATVTRAWPRYLLRIFIPFIAVVSVSLFILWAPKSLKVDQAGITYSALLALAALSFTFESSFPGSMSVNSPIAFMISLGYFYLVLTLLVHLALSDARIRTVRSNPFLLAEIRANVRYTLPLTFALICTCSVIRSLS